MMTLSRIGALCAASAIRYCKFRRGGLISKYLIGVAVPRGRILVDVDAVLRGPCLAALNGFAAPGV